MQVLIEIFEFKSVVGVGETIEGWGRDFDLSIKSFPLQLLTEEACTVHCKIYFSNRFCVTVFLVLIFLNYTRSSQVTG